MRKYTLILCMLCMLLSLNLYGVIALAEVEDTAEEYSHQYVQNINFTSLDYEPSRRGHISCFAVSENGDIAIGSELHETTILVYSSDGTFKYGCRFYSSSAEFLSFEGDILNIYFSRSEVIISINPEGKVCGVGEFDYNNNEDVAKFHSIQKANKKTVVGDKVYYVNNKNKIMNLVFGHSQLLVEDANQEITVLYEANYVNPYVIFLIIFPIGFAIAVIGCIIRAKERI